MNEIAQFFATHDIVAIAAGSFIVVVLLFVLLFVLYIFYMVDIQRAMDALPPDNRPFPGATIWLALLPMMGVIWQFIFLFSLSLAIQREFTRRRVREGSGFGLVSAQVVMSCLTFVPSLFLSLGDIGYIFALIFITFLIVPFAFIQLFHWRSIRRCRKTLLRTASWAGALPSGGVGWPAQAPFPGHASAPPSLPSPWGPPVVPPYAAPHVAQHGVSYTPAAAPHAAAYAAPQATPYGAPYGAPHGGPHGAPYGAPDGTPYAAPYAAPSAAPHRPYGPPAGADGDDGWSVGGGVPSSSSSPSARNPAVDQALAVAIEDQVVAVGRVSRDGNRSLVVVVVVALLLIAGVVFGIDALSNSSSAAAGPTHVIVSTALANVRDSGTARGAVVGKVAQGTPCDVSAESEGWSQVHCVPRTGAVVDGWIKSSLLSPAPSSPNTTANSSTSAATTTTTARLRFHSVPEGADVYEEGTFGETNLGVTPLVVTWSVDGDARRREFVVKKNGYVSARAHVDPPTPAANGGPLDIDVTATLRPVSAATEPAGP
jgi:SH3-like domain-containing protein